MPQLTLKHLKVNKIENTIAKIEAGVSLRKNSKM